MERFAILVPPTAGAGRGARFAVGRALPGERFAPRARAACPVPRVAEPVVVAARDRLAGERGLRRTSADTIASVRVGISLSSTSSIFCSSLRIDAASFAV